MIILDGERRMEEQIFTSYNLAQARELRGRTFLLARATIPSNYHYGPRRGDLQQDRQWSLYRLHEKRGVELRL
jgi:hypothetical protein